MAAGGNSEGDAAIGLRAALGDRRLLVLVAALVALALVLRLGAVAATPEFVPRTDAADYDAVALSLATGEGYPDSGLTAEPSPSAFRPPGYPLLLAGIYAVTGTSSENRWEGARVVACVLGALIAALIGLVAFQLWGPVVGLIALGLAAVYPPLILPSTSLLSEAPFLVLQMGALAAVLAYRRSSNALRWTVIAGVLGGLAALTRSNGLLLLLPLVLAVWRSPLRSRASLVPVVVLLGAAVLTVAPWTIRNAVQFDALVPVSTQDGFGVAGTYNEAARDDPRYPSAWRPPTLVPQYLPLFKRRDLDEAELNAELRHRSRDFLLDHPAYLASVLYHNTIRMLNLSGPDVERIAAADLGVSRRVSDASVYAFWLVALIALVGAFTTAARAAPPFLWLVPFLMFASVVIVAGLTRYRLPVDPFVVMLAALALTSALRRFRLAPP